MTDDLIGRLEAVEVCVEKENWDRAEDGLLDALAEVRKRKASHEEATT